MVSLAPNREEKDMSAGPGLTRMFWVLSVCLAPGASVASGLLPDPTSQAIQYQSSRDWFWCADQVMGLAVPILVLFSGLAGRLAERSYRLTGNRWFAAIALFAIAYATIDFSLNLPLAFWEGYVNEHHFGLGTGSPGRWMKEQLVGYVVTLIGVSLLTWVPYFFVRATPRLWWLWSAVAFVPVFILMQIVSPIWIAPLTNRFEPLGDKSLEARIDALARRAGISGATILVKDESRTSKLPNAGVRGMFGTTRIVVNDNLIEQTNERELLVVLAHEMGHYVRADVWKFISIPAGLVLAGFWLAHRLGRAVLPRFESRWGFGSLSSIASLPLLYLTFNLAVLATTPAVNAFIRNVEHNADLFALDLTHDNDAAMSFIRKMAKVYWYVPSPGWFRRNFRMDHPSLDDRARFLLTYHPWDPSPQHTRMSP
jgi:STE24 endopeptidase